MQFDIISWLIGIPTGIGVNWFSQWLYRKLSKKFKSKGEYFTATYYEDSIDFEGHVNARISAEEIISKFLHLSIKDEITDNQSTINI